MLRLTLRSLGAQTGPIRQLRCHVNDSDSYDPQRIYELVPEGLRPRLVVTSSRNNLGFAEAHNQLLTAAFEEGAGHVLVLNPDLALTPSALSDLVAASGRLHHLH